MRELTFAMNTSCEISSELGARGAAEGVETPL